MISTTSFAIIIDENKAELMETSITGNKNIKTKVKRFVNRRIKSAKEKVQKIKDIWKEFKEQRTQENGIGFGSILALLLGVAFIVLKLTGVIAWSWLWVLAPFWIPAGVTILVFIFVFIIAFIVELAS
jgi:sterol desaturase/sphingolipid hydroxylase (fatty acid hydroxylase superfamily)